MNHQRLVQFVEEARRETHNAMIKHQQVGRMGDFRFNTRTGVSYRSLECYKLFGFDPHLPEVDFSTWTEKIVPEDRQRIKDELAAAILVLRPFKFEYRIELDGGIRYIVCEGLAICRKTVTAHNDRIWAVRNPEHGLTVNFTTQIVRAGAH